MRFCVKCGEPLIDGETNCPKCGAQIRKGVYQKAIDQSDIDSNIVALDNSPIIKRKKILACFSLAFSLICALMLLLIAVRAIVRMISVDAFTFDISAKVFSVTLLDPIWIAVIITCILGVVLGAIATRRVNKKRLLQGRYFKCANLGTTIAIACFAITYVWIIFAGIYVMFLLFAVMWMRPPKEEQIENAARVLQNLHNFYIAKVI